MLHSPSEKGLSISQPFYVLSKGTTSSKISMIVFMGFATLIETLIQYRIGVAPAEMTKDIINNNQNEFIRHLMQFLASVIFISFVVGLKKYLAEKLAISYRQTLTRRLHNEYCYNNRFYNILTDDPELDNPDSRISQDVSDFTKEVFNVIMKIIQVPAMILWYSYRIAVDVDVQTVIVCILFDILALLLTRLAMSPVMEWTYELQARQADFRLDHLNLRENAESICFMKGQRKECEHLDTELENLLTVQASLANVSVPLKLCMKLFAFFGPIVVYFLIYVYIGKHHELQDPGDLAALAMRSVFSVLMLVYAFTSYFQVNELLAKVCGLAARIRELWVALERQPLRIANRSVGDSVILDGVTVETPSGDVLLRNVSFTVDYGSSLFISGPTGCGKSSIFRVIAGLWAPKLGRVTAPLITDPSQIMVLTEIPYLSSGNVLEYFAFPDPVSKIDKTELSEAIAFLRLGGLIHPGMDEWPPGMSPGEKQRIALIRVLVHKPRFLLLDEATCAIPEALESEFYERCLKLNISLISIAHNQSLRNFHKLCFEIDEYGNHKICQTENVL